MPLALPSVGRKGKSFKRSEGQKSRLECPKIGEIVREADEATVATRVGQRRCDRMPTPTTDDGRQVDCTVADENVFQVL